ncbi:D-alanine--D-alanine ligase family protein [Thermosediminibacter litoriperuensis]|uniref:D-alanine--D-alanine ligase n=1 Tax=Thermosediminibacter litoriperuensis TaxID=291989 RepID=A0A5S5AK10_9FIRM|nr:D-alanine--D-alanine ligase family protein [Thermosediminibacter litoriperuensis]TYP49759.1 D-alanine-D-alanine ligase [Thermosediminibacter litoriperuensis]
MEKLKVGVVFGGQSGEYEVSLMSATSIINVMDKSKYDIVPIGITKDGRWHVFFGDVSKIQDGTWVDEAVPAFLPPDTSYKCAITLKDGIETRYYLDVIFPVLHGPHGEDGTVQGVFELMNIPYVSCGVGSSAVCMDKVFSKKLLKQEGLPVVDFKVFYKKDLPAGLMDMVAEVEKSFGYPCFVKPANLGSSVGVTKAHDREELKNAILHAAEFDRKLLVERFIPAREIECAVLGNDDPVASLPGEIIPSEEFYSYIAKYFDGGKSKLLIPAPLATEETEKIRDLAVRAYKALDCTGMARVDFLLSKVTGIIYINELNTIPGFTNISMYPKMWEASGLPYKELIDKLIGLAIERHRQKQALKLTL